MTNEEKQMHMTLAEAMETYGIKDKAIKTTKAFICSVLDCTKCPGNKSVDCRSGLAEWLDDEAEDVKMTEGDRIRRMSDRELAVWRDTLDREAWENGAGGGTMKFGETNIDFWTGYFGHPADEDYEG